jgi:hypothetical protein
MEALSSYKNTIIKTRSRSAIDQWVIEIHLRTVFQVLDYSASSLMLCIVTDALHPFVLDLGNRPVKASRTESGDSGYTGKPTHFIPQPSFFTLASQK